MAMTARKRQKLARMAAAKESPNEARVAADMLLREYTSVEPALDVSMWQWAGYVPSFENRLHLAIGSASPYIVEQPRLAHGGPALIEAD
jgi:hypothetical protein